jgi:hypothetical protein
MINEAELRKVISEVLQSRIDAVINMKMEEWYRQKIETQVDEAIKLAFSKMMIIKFGE